MAGGRRRCHESEALFNEKAPWMISFLATGRFERVANADRQIAALSAPVLLCSSAIER